jgi:hypothetical protein
MQMAQRTLVTVATDGFRDYVDLPDGRQVNLGSVSVLKLVSSLVRGSYECRRALDTFLKKRQVAIAVDLYALEDMLKPKRARWASYDDPFIPIVPVQSTELGPIPKTVQQGRGASMDPDIAQAEAMKNQIVELEKQIALVEQTAKEHASGSQSADQLQGAVESLKALVTELGKPPKGQSDNSAFYFKLSSLEGILSKLEGCGCSTEADVTAFHMTASDLFAEVTGKTIKAAVDTDVLEDLELFMENTSSLHNQFNSIIANVKRKMESGKYDPKLSPKLWLYWVEDGVKAYAKEFSVNPRQQFPMELKRALAERFSEHYDAAVKNGEYGELKVKKASDDQEPEQEVAKESSETQEEDVPKKVDESKTATEVYYKLAASDVPAINEAFADSVMSKVDNALRTIEASSKKGTEVAKKDLNTISSRLATLIQESSLDDPALSVALRKLSGMVDQVQSHFA